MMAKSAKSAKSAKIVLSNGGNEDRYMPPFSVRSNSNSVMKNMKNLKVMKIMKN